MYHVLTRVLGKRRIGHYILSLGKKKKNSSSGVRQFWELSQEVVEIFWKKTSYNLNRFCKNDGVYKKENRQRDRWRSSGGVSASLCSKIDRSATNLGCNFATVVLVSLKVRLVNQTTSTRAPHALSIEKLGQTLYSPRNLLCSYLPDKRVVCVWVCGEVTIPCHDSLLAVRSPNSKIGNNKTIPL